MLKAVFLDRDGTITVEPPHYTHKLSDLHFYPGVPEAIARLNKDGFIVVVVSNQAGIARGYYQEEDAQRFNAAMIEKISNKGGRIDGVYYCPHHVDGSVEKYKINCDCRKPKPGMIMQAVAEFNISLADSFIVGDNLSDIQTGINTGCKTILVKTGHGLEVLEDKDFSCDHIAEDLASAIDYILE